MRMVLASLTLPLLLALGAQVGCAQAPAPLDPPAAAKLTLAREARTAGLLEEALARAEEALQAAPRNPAVWGERGKVCYATATRNQAMGLGGLQVSGFLEDARHSLEKAISLGSPDAEVRVFLARTLLAQGRTADASRAADEALPLARDRAARLEALLVAGAALAARMQELGAESDRPAREKLGGQAVRLLDEAAQLDPDRAGTWADLARVWGLLGDPARELEILRRGLARNPGSESLHLGIQDRLLAAGRPAEAVGLLATLLKDDPENATALWYLGRARMAVAEGHRGEKRPAEAAAAYREAIAAFRDSCRLRPAYTAASDQSIAYALLGIGNQEIEQGRLQEGRETLLQAFAAWPGVFDRPDRFGLTYAGAMGLLGRKLLGGDRGLLSADPKGGAPVSPLADPAESARAAVAHFRDLIARHPDRKEQHGFWLNNIGLALRDLGTLLADRAQGDGPPAAAMAAWEEAYAAYTQAMASLPDDPRIVNDCAVMLVYHLNRDFDRAEELLRRAAELGQAVLDEKGDELDEESRNFYEEAVGDAWQNLGLLSWWHRQEKQKARELFKKAFLYYPYGNRAAAASMRGIDLAGKEARAAGPPAWIAACWLPLPPEDPEITSIRKSLEEAAGAAPAAAKGIYSDAAWQAETFLKKNPRSAVAGLLLGRALVGLAGAEKQGRKPDGLAISGSYDEASRRLRTALDADPDLEEARRLLLDVELERGDREALAGAARGAAEWLAAKGSGLPEERRLPLAAMAGHCLYDAYARAKAGSAKVDEKDGELAATLLEGVLERGIRGRGSVPGVSAPQVVAADLALLRQWQGKAAAAVPVLQRWLEAAGPEASILQALFNAGRAGATEELVAAFGALAKKRPDDPTLLWYLGAAQGEAGDARRRLGEWDEAVAHYDRAVATMRRVLELEPAFTANSQTFIVRSLAGKGYVARSTKRADDAARLFLEALALNPEMRNVTDNFNLTPALGIAYLSDDWLKAKSLDKAVALLREAVKLVPGEADWHNNLGLFARDLGTELERSGKAQEAKEYYEISLAGYRAAVKLRPEDPRLLNDLALIMIYHVPRELEGAEELLKKAVALGAKQLEEFPADDPGGRQLLDEAVGDAWQNLGVFYARARQDLEAAEKAFRQSLKHFSPSNRSEVRGHLRNLERLRAEAREREKGEAEPGEGKKGGGVETPPGGGQEPGQGGGGGR